MKCTYCKIYDKKKYMMYCSEQCFIKSMVWKKNNCWFMEKEKIKKTTTRRYVYNAFVGPIPEDSYVIPVCASKNCINPKHLMPVDSYSFRYEMNMAKHKKIYVLKKMSFSDMMIDYYRTIRKKIAGVIHAIYRQCSTSDATD